jgi:hypothetical protein
VLAGGAGGMGEKEFETAAQVLPDEVVPVAERRDAVVIDVDTDSGVVQLIGRARSAWAVDFRSSASRPKVRSSYRDPGGRRPTRSDWSRTTRCSS